MPEAATSDYRLSRAFSARLVGLLVVLVAVLVLVATVVIAIADLSTVVLAPVALVGIAAVLGVGALVRRTPVLHLDDHGYRIRLVRGAGVKEAGWRQVSEVVAASPRDVPCVVLRLRDGGTSTVPVAALEDDPATVVDDLRRRLQRGHGLRPYDS